VPTVCYGETKGVKIGDSYTKPECDAMLARRVAEFRDGLAGCIPIDMPEGMAVVLVDWSYNIGIGAACRSTLARKANAGDLFGACDQLLVWNKGRINGKLQRIQGLANRREAERALCVKSLIDAGYSRPAR
jgi:lysozyme